MDKNYSDLISKLLTDMETFLTSKFSEIELHTAAEENRKELLKQIEFLRQQLSFESQEYIEMNGNIPRKEITVTDPVEECTPEYVNEYVNEDADQPNESPKSCTIIPGTCNDYENQNVLQPEEQLGWPPEISDEPLQLGQINPPSAPALKAMAIKCGPLQRKDRFMFMDQFRRFWVGLHGRHLYFYTSDRDSKPQHVLDLSDYTARHAPEAIRDSKKKPLCFEVVCPGNKTQQFIARTPKDMEQWIAVITRVNQRTNPDYILRRERNSTYDDAADTKSKLQRCQREVMHARSISDDGEDAIYHDIQDGHMPNLYDDAVGCRGTYSSYEEETYDDVGAWREKVEEIEEEEETEDRVEMTALGTDEIGGVINGIRLPVVGGRIRQLVKLMEEEGVIKGDECGRRRDEGGGGKIMEEGKDH